MKKYILMALVVVAALVIWQQKRGREEIVPGPRPTEEGIVLEGRLEEMERPAEDIAYDYKLVLDEPFEDEIEDGMGESIRDEVILVVDDPELEEVLADNVGGQIKVSGEMEWGYAETRHFRIHQILK